MKKTILVLALTLMASSTMASAVFGVGGSVSSKFNDPGATIMIGTQFVVDSTKDMHMRTMFSKMNWGNNLDKITAMWVTYWTLPIWDQVKFGLHFQADYETESSSVGAAIGGEIYKHLFGENGMYISGDFISLPDVDNDYILLSVGLIANF